jgi:plasmid stabilization system protein ParE
VGKKVEYSRRAEQNIEEIFQFYSAFDRETADKAVQTIVLSLRKLVDAPTTGRPVIDSKRLRERVIPFGGQGFLALYEIFSNGQGITIAAVRHQRQVGYKEEKP